MALARIRTHFPEEVGELCDALIEAGYTVETIRPEEYRIAPADLELTVDKLPVVEAWRHVPNAENIFVAPGTPQSGDIRSSLGAKISREPLVAKMLIISGETFSDLSRWATRQARELRAWQHSLRERQWPQPSKGVEWLQEHFARLRTWSLQIRDRWTPPREYNQSVHLEPNVSDHKERIDRAIEQARVHAEELRQRKEAEDRRLQERARMAEDNRRRAREAAEAKAMLEHQQKIEAMVRASEALREQVVAGAPPAPHLVQRQRPRPKMRFLPRTRREHAYFRAGITAFTLSLFLAVVAAQAFHPRPAAGAIPLAKASTTTIASQPAPSPSIVMTKPAATTTATEVNPSLKDAAAAATMDATSTATTSPKPPALRSVAHRAHEEDMIADDEVIVHKNVTRRTVAKPKQGVVHYSDLN